MSIGSGLAAAQIGIANESTVNNPGSGNHVHRVPQL